LLVSGYILLLWAAWRDHFGTGRKGVLAVVLALAGSISAWVYYLLTGYNADRIQILLHPEQDPLGTGYQAMTVRTALQVARWLGKGEWTGYAGYTEPFERTVPAWSSDFFLTTVIYKLGWLPFLLLVLAFAALVLWLLVKCLRQTNQLGRLVSAAVALTLGLHGACSTALNLGFVLFGGMFPLVTGNLTSVLYMIMIGLALSVFRQERIPADITVPSPNVPHRPLISWQDGDLIIALGERD
jgi:cell division protein FtsW (lipid II flippase)